MIFEKSLVLGYDASCCPERGYLNKAEDRGDSVKKSADCRESIFKENLSVAWKTQNLSYCILFTKP